MEIFSCVDIITKAFSKRDITQENLTFLHGGIITWRNSHSEVFWHGNIFLHCEIYTWRHSNMEAFLHKDILTYRNFHAETIYTEAFLLIDAKVNFCRMLLHSVSSRMSMRLGSWSPVIASMNGTRFQHGPPISCVHNHSYMDMVTSILIWSSDKLFRNSTSSRL